ncbi:hypothetical protein TeGR_g13156 [Tetraparma gracilis]|uniref:Uncharacterized protein n=1 Tax=Tetraparma gracilis TaxID=2962635 RepID=A0ABQ6MAS2_9STRA|nr:hypothetical protein TeGR_g13156 [Tetraparma gracilis]
MSKIPYGVKARAAAGAAVSTSDMVSDGVIVADYFRTGRTGFAYALLAMVGANMLFNLLFTWVQTRGIKKGRLRKVAFEVAATLTCTKPGLDAWKVASGAEQQPGAPFTPLVEMAAAKAAEVATEGVPGLVLQLFAVLMSSSKERSTLALLSIAISAASTGLAGTSIFYDSDTDPGQRARNPKWYGLVPDQGRGKAYAVILAMCSLQALTKGSAVALLAVTNSDWLRGYIAIDVGIYFGYKLVRGEYLNYVPLPFWPSAIFSTTANIIFKLVGDYTGCPSMSLPNFFGGAYFLSNLLLSHVSMMAAVWLYIGYYDDEGAGRGDKIEASTLWTCAAALTTAWVVAFTFFATRVVVPKYRRVLYNNMTSRQWCASRYLEGETDREKLHVFRTNKILWEKEIGEDVKAWTLENWARLEGEAWFDAKVKAKIPDEYIPATALQQLGGRMRQRRGSAAGSVRESMREDVEEEEGGGV